MILLKQGIFNIYEKQYLGITQELNKRNYIDSISHIRKINKININNINAPEDMRFLKNSNFGYICCNETPETLDVGITKYLSIFSLITEEISLKSMKKINNFINEYKNKNDEFKIFINNNYICFTDMYFLEKFKLFRQKNYDLKYVSIFEFDKNYYINTLGGRYIKPLLKKNNIKFVKKNYNFKDYYLKNIIEYIDVYEFKNCKLDVTHLELNELSILGISASMTPFLNANQSTRITFQSGMIKQSISLTNNISNISDIKVLIYSQVPVCKTIINDILDFKTFGTNVLINVLPYNGYNQEDSLIFKKSSIEKGIFSSYRFDLQEIILNKEIFEIDFDFFPKEGREVKYDDNIIIKKNKINGKKEFVKVKYNTSFHKNIINKIIVTTMNNNYIIKIQYKRYDIIKTGDKLSSRYSQKGVIGRIEYDINLPFNKEGLVPDIIINPHSFPSRMTIGHIIETIKCVEGIMNNRFVNSTGFYYEQVNNFYKKSFILW